MSRLDESLRPLAARLVARAGTAMTWRHAGLPAYDPASGEVAAAPAEIAVTGVIEQAEATPDGAVHHGDLMVTFAAEPLPADPMPGDGLLIGGIVHRVVAVAATWAGARPVLFRLHVRR